ncbi:MAG: hypothetical protein JWQ35_2549 [Bacteriovoracaceae bacterium]|nr:hypothetical protein [Bacteriovoracaceae bacterium]
MFCYAQAKIRERAAWHCKSKREIGADIPKGCRPRFSPTSETHFPRTHAPNAGSRIKLQVTDVVHQSNQFP